MKKICLLKLREEDLPFIKLREEDLPFIKLREEDLPLKGEGKLQFCCPAVVPQLSRSCLSKLRQEDLAFKAP